VSIWKGIYISDQVFIGPNVVFTNDLWPISRAKNTFIETQIQMGACVGANSTIVAGSSMGKYSFLGAGSVLTKVLPDYCLAYGVPAKIQKYVCSCREILEFIEKKRTVCLCGKIFELKDNHIIINLKS